MIRILVLILFSMPVFADEALIACRDVPTIAKRVACYDHLVDVRYPRQSQATDSIDPDRRSTLASASTSATTFGKPRQPVTTYKEIHATVQAVEKSTHQKLIITLDNNQIWRQLDSGPMRLLAGDAVTIRTALFDSYQLRKASGGKSIRVKRLD